jgi:hypothetical protein
MNATFKFLKSCLRESVSDRQKGSENRNLQVEKYFIKEETVKQFLENLLFDVDKKLLLY